MTGGSGPAPQLSFDPSTNRVAPASGYTYDAAGNVIWDGVSNYTYDAEGNLTKVDGGATASYTFNALNQRVRIDFPSDSSASEEFIYDPWGRHTSSYDVTDGWGWADWVYWGTSTTRVAVDVDAQEYFDHADWEGTERVRTTYNGNIDGLFDSLPFGDGYTVTGTDRDPYHFAMMDKDYYEGVDSGTDHATFRQYSETAGRWMSPDPYAGSYDFSNPQTFNRYSYVMNNPLAFIDPLGRQCVPVGTAGAVECTASLAYDGAAAASGSGSLAWLGSLGGFFSNPITAGIVGGGLGIYELGKLVGWWGGPSFHGSLQPRPSAPNTCTGTGVLVGVGGNADLGLVEGGSAQGSIMAGTTTTSTGGTLSGGAMVGGPLGTIGAPTQITHSAVLGGYVGAGVQVGFTNAGSMQALSGPFKTLSFNIGLGQANFGTSLSWSGHIFQLNLTIPGLSEGAGVAASYITTTTKVRTVNAVHNGPC